MNQSSAKRKPQQEEQKPVSDLDIVLGFAEVEVQYKPAKALDDVTLQRMEKFQELIGKKEIVRVRVLDMDKMPGFWRTLNNELRACELYCGRPEGWGNLLTPQSQNEIANKGADLNMDFFREWFSRNSRWLEITNSGLISEMRKQIEELLKKASASANSAPQSPTTTN